MVWSLFSISIRRWKYLILSQININIFIFIWPSNKQTEKPILWFWAKISMLSFFSSVVLVFTFALYLVLCNRLIRYGRTSRIISAAILCMLLILLKALRKLVPVFSSFCELRVQVPFFLLFQPQLSSVCACAGNTALPGIQGFLWCLLSSYIDIHCLPPEVLMGLIPGGLILPRYWDSSQCWYCEGWSRVSPVAAGLMEEWQTAGLVSEELK